MADLRLDFAEALAESRGVAPSAEVAQPRRTRVVEAVADNSAPMRKKSRLSLNPVLILASLAATLTLAGAIWSFWPRQETDPAPPRYVLQDGRIVENRETKASPEVPAADHESDTLTPVADDDGTLSAAEPMEQAAYGLEEAPIPANADATEALTDIEQLLALANESRLENRLTRPLEQSAVHYYQRVLQIDSDNAAARQGLAEVVSDYLDLARTELGKARYDRAQTFIERGLTVNPVHPELRALLAQIKRESSLRRREPADSRIAPPSSDPRPEREREGQGFNRK